MSAIKAIKAWCTACASTPQQRDKCTKTDCVLYPYRNGHNPARTGQAASLSRNGGMIVSTTKNHLVDGDKILRGLTVGDGFAVPAGYELRIVKKP